jgi:hypothetical protein
MSVSGLQSLSGSKSLETMGAEHYRLFSFSAKNWQSTPELANISCEGVRRDLNPATRHP